MSRTFPQLAEELINELNKKNYNVETAKTLLTSLNKLPYEREAFVNAEYAIRISESCMRVSNNSEISLLTSELVTKIALTQDLLKAILHHDWHYSYIMEVSITNQPPKLINNLHIIMSANDYIRGTMKYVQLLMKEEEWFNNSMCFSPLDVAIKFAKIAVNIVNNNIITINKSLLKSVIDCCMKRSHRIDALSYSILMLNCVNLLSKILLRQPDLMYNYIPMLIGICHFFGHVGLNDIEAFPAKIYPTQQIVAPNITRNQNSGKKQKLRKAVNKTKAPEEEPDYPTSYQPCTKDYLNSSSLKAISALQSDQEASDSENVAETEILTVQSKLRKSASNLLLVIFKIFENHNVFGYWMVFMPNYPDAENWAEDPSCKRTLAYCATYDPRAVNREAALKAMLEMLSKSRHYLSHAEASKKVTSAFIPFSETMAYSLTCLHKVLHNLLKVEQSLGNVILALKCCAVLIQATPYHKMQPGLITEILLPARKYMYYKDVRLQVGALIVIGCFLSINPKVDEIYKLIESDSSTVKKESTFLNINARGDKEISDFEEGYSSDEDADEVTPSPTQNAVKSWILDKCFMNLGFTFKGDEVVKCKPAGIKVILESLQVLSAITFHHFDYLLLSHMNLLADIMCEMLKSDNQEILLQAAKTVSIIGDALAKLEKADNAAQSQQWVTFWQKILTPLSSVLQNVENPIAKVIACDCIANIGETSFKELPRNQQMLCCALLVGLCSDQDESVRGAAVRALAMVVMYKILREDMCFVTDCGENIICALQTKIPIIRAKAAWALGNYTDALVLNFIDPEIENIEDALLMKLLTTSIECTADDDVKIKMSIPRALGNLLRIVTQDKLQSSVGPLNDLVLKALQSLYNCTNNTKNMKVMWNVCHAMGNAMKNDVLYDLNDNSNTTIRGVYFKRLVSLSQSCANFKVRINAVVALRSPRTRVNYGDHYWDIWLGLLIALQNTASVPYDTAFRHKDNLIEQIFVSLAHLTCLLTPEDESRGILTNHEENLKSLANNLYKLLPPEKESCIKMLEAAKHLLKLPPTEEVLILKEVFICELDSCVVPFNTGLVDA